MADVVKRGRTPSFLFLSYVPDLWRVRDLFLVLAHFFSASAIERRRELGPSARRAGWVGCNILLNRLPPEARIYAVSGYEAVPPTEVRERWRRFAFLKREPPQSRGWTADVLTCVRELGRDTFTLSDAYAFEGRLVGLHPRNRNVRPKIRQQLQVLRDHGIIRFLGSGKYRIT
jgi:type II restriction enzyme